jgi:Ca2+-binding EF-hand superfamily protein
VLMLCCVAPVGDEFPAAVSDLLDFSATAEDKALTGEWAAQKSHTISNHDERVAAHAERLAELKAKKDAMNKDPDLKMKLAKLGGAAKGGAAATKNLVLSPVETALMISKHTAAHAGVPGTGVVKSHAAHARHHSLDRMQGADSFLPHKLSDVFEEVSEITLLFNCFTVGYYGLHIAPVLIPSNFSGPVYALAHIAVMLPALLLMVLLAPVSTKYTCLLDCVVYKDQETIAEVYHAMTQLIVEKNAIKKQLLKNGMKMAHDKGVDDSQMEIGTIAKLVFEDIDQDGGGFLDYTELRDGLARVHVYLAAKDFRNIMECIDPNLDGRISCDEWVEFLRASDEQLQTDEWRTFKKLVAVRKRVSAELIRRVMAVETLDESATVESLLTAIFDSMDTDQSKSLSDGELREGMAAYGLSLSHDDLQTISDYIMREGLEGELTLSQWLEFAKASEGELPQPGDEDAPTVGEAEQPGGGTFETESFETENVENPVKRQSALKLGSADEV